MEGVSWSIFYLGGGGGGDKIYHETIILKREIDVEFDYRRDLLKFRFVVHLRLMHVCCPFKINVSFVYDEFEFNFHYIGYKIICNLHFSDQTKFSARMSCAKHPGMCTGSRCRSHSPVNKHACVVILHTFNSNFLENV